MNPNEMLQEFLKRLAEKTSEQLLREIEQAREDSKDSWMMEETEGE